MDRRERLERANCRLRWIVCGLATLMLLAFGTGATVGRKELILDRLVIRDSAGRQRIEMEGDTITWYDSKGTIRVLVTALDDGTAGVTICDKNETARVGAGVLADGTAVLSLFDANGQQRVCTQTIGRSAAVLHKDAGGRDRIMTGTSRSNAKSVYTDTNGNKRVRVGTNADGTVAFIGE